MQRRKSRGRSRQLPLLLSVLALCFIGSRLLPLTRPILRSSLQSLAMTSVLSAQPQNSAALWREEMISLQDKLSVDIPVVEDFEENLPVSVEDITEEKEELPPVVEDKTEAAPSLVERADIPKEYQGPIIEESMSGQSKSAVPSYGAALIKNNTQFSDQEILDIIAQESKLSITTDGPQVLIYHTHATESFEPYDSDIYDTRNTWRSTNERENMVAVGDAIAAAIEAHGIQVIHDTTLHDYPSYNGSYERSAVTIQHYLEEYPSICVALDIHRDAIQREDTLVKPVTTINGQKVAQLMIVSGCDDGSLNIPTWQDNLRLGVRLQDQIESCYPGLCRPLFLTHRKYNQHLTHGSLLFEVGSHGNTLKEALLCGEMAGDAIGAYLAELLP